MGAGVMTSPENQSVTPAIFLETAGPLKDKSAQMTQTGPFKIPGSFD